MDGQGDACEEGVYVDPCTTGGLWTWFMGFFKPCDEGNNPEPPPECTYVDGKWVNCPVSSESSESTSKTSVGLPASHHCCDDGIYWGVMPAAQCMAMNVPGQNSDVPIVFYIRDDDGALQLPVCPRSKYFLTVDDNGDTVTQRIICDATQSTAAGCVPYGTTPTAIGDGGGDGGQLGNTQGGSSAGMEIQFLDVPPALYPVVNPISPINP